MEHTDTYEGLRYEIVQTLKFFHETGNSNYFVSDFKPIRLDYVEEGDDDGDYISAVTYDSRLDAIRLENADGTAVYDYDDEDFDIPSLARLYSVI